MTIDDLIAELRSKTAGALEKRAEHTTALADLRAREVKGEDITEAEVEAHRSAKGALDAEVDGYRARMVALEDEKRADDAATKAAAEYHTTNVRKPAYDGVARVGQDKRQYNPDADRKGMGFLRDVGLRALGDYGAADRLSRHMAEEAVERAGFDFTERAVGTGQFAGLTVPQYLTDMYAPNAKPNRPLADACNKHVIPESGMTVNLSLITTGSTAAVQATQNTAVSETNMADTLLSIPVKTNAGQQTVSRQGIERGTGIEETVLDDLFRAYNTKLDSTLINEAATGLTNVATAIAYTDATPTAAELYPKFLQGFAAVEAALLDQDPGDNIVVMHSRRWYWLQNAVGSTWPFAQQPGILPQMGLVNLAERYGGGVRGVLPNGTAVIVDNNISTTLGAGTEDEIYVLSQREAHLWEDPSAPMMIRAEQPSAASLGVLFVVYGYFAYTFARYAQSQKINGTGLIAPSFTGV